MINYLLLKYRELEAPSASKKVQEQKYFEMITYLNFIAT